MEIKKILFTTDFSEGTAHAMKYAIGMAKQFGAQLHLLHTVHNIFIYPGLHIPHGSFDVMNKELEESAKKAMQKLCLSIGESCKDITSSVVHGIPYEEILKHASANSIDLIIIGTHGRKGLDRALLGSTAERVVRNAQCPVLTVRMPM
jgi:nucleotide-binding universal stress UspA family protein